MGNTESAAQVRNVLDANGDPVVLGQGAFSVVYKGILNSNSVAIKKFNASHLGSMCSEIIEYEANMLEKLQHDNVIKMIGYDLNRSIIVFEFAERGNLRKLIGSPNTKSEVSIEGRGYSIIFGMICGLEYLHSQDVLHLDLKSENILIDKNWTVKIADVGLSRKKEEHATHVSTFCNKFTINWAPPESFESQTKLTTASDIYSLGSIIFEIVSGDIPWRGLSEEAIKYQVLRGHRPTMESASCPEEIKKLIQQTWSATQRPSIQTVKQVVAPFEKANRIPEPTKEQLTYLREISKSPGDAIAYYNLGCSVPNNGKIELLNKQLFTKAQLYIKAISLDPNYYNSYTNLGTILPDGGSIRLLNNTVMTKKQLFMKAIDLNPKHANSYFNLGTTLSSEESITLLNNTVTTQKQLYLKAISLDPKLENAYYNLALSLRPGETVELFNKTMTKRQLYIKAIEVNPKQSRAYYNIAIEMEEGETIELADKSMMTKEQLYLKTIALDPSFANAYINLGNALKAGERIELPDKSTMTKRQLYLKAIDLSPETSIAYRNLALTLSNNSDTVTLLNGVKMTKGQLLLK